MLAPFLNIGKSRTWSVSCSALLTRLFFHPVTCSFGTLEGPRRPSLHRVDPCSPCLHWLAAEWWPGAESVSWFRSPLEWSSFLTFVLCTDKEISEYQPVWRNYIASSYTCFMEKEIATHSSTLAWKIPWTEGPWGGEESNTTERLHFHFSLSCIGEGNGFDIPEWEASLSRFLNSPRDCLYWKPNQFILKMWRMEKIVP